jgi:hypothetical protein
MLRPLLALALLASSGCAVLGPVASLDDVRPRAQVQIEFDEPRTVHATSAGVVHEFRAIRSLRGEVDDVRPDTIVLRLGRLDSAVPAPELPRNALYIYVAQSGAQVSTWRQSPFSWIAGLGAGVFALHILTCTNYC